MTELIRQEIDLGNGRTRIRFAPASQVGESKRAVGLACPMISTDTMDPVEHVDGKFYTSKSAYRAVTKAHGYVEVGNDPARHRREPPPKPDRKAIKEAVAKAIAQHT